SGFGRRRQANELGFLDLPGNQALHRQSTDFASRARGQFDDVVVLGIGGSALGPIALRTALLKPQWNALTKDERGGWPRMQVLDIPPNVGGRYSVLTPVGILPAALAGMDTAALLAGAGEIAQRCESDALAKNPAGTFATLQFLADTKLGRQIHVLMPYSDPLRDIADWFVQLWAESLGKHRRADDPGIGPTPLAALGATDQHSKVQLFMEGPPDKTVSFISVEEEAIKLEIPKL